MMMALAITHSVLAMPTAVITLSSEHDIEQHDLRDHTGEAQPRVCGLLAIEPIAFQGVMDLPRALVEQEQAARDQNDIAPRDRMAEEIEQRLGEADYPSNRGKQRQAGKQSQCQSDLPCPVLLFCRQSPGEDRDEHQVVDTEHDLEGGQCQKAYPDFRIGYPIHIEARAWLTAPRP